MILLFDFDGVICDSAFEAFRIALTTAGCIQDPFVSDCDHLYEKFLEKRTSVGPAWNYHYVMDELIHNKWHPWKNNKLSNAFARSFFSVRKQAQKNQKEWISLNPFYPKISEILTNHTISVLTNKNKAPVEMLLDYHGIRYDTIISMPEQHVYQNKCDLMNDYFRGEQIKFIDDHIGIVSDVISRTKLDIDVKHASWGYTKKNIEGITITMAELENWLINV